MGLKKILFSRAVIYPAVGILTYLISKTFFPTEAEKEERERLKDLPIIKDPDPLTIKDPDPLDIKGGFLPKNFLRKVFENNSKHLMWATFAIFSVIVGDRCLAAMGQLVIGASPALMALPAPLARRLLEGLYNKNPKEILGTLKEGFLSTELTVDEKLQLLKHSLHSLIISAQTVRTRRALLISALFIVIGTAFANGPVFASIPLVLQDFFTVAGFKRATVKFVVSIYQEYNAPMPLELYELMKDVGLVNATICN